MSLLKVHVSKFVSVQTVVTYGITDCAASSPNGWGASFSYTAPPDPVVLQLADPEGG